MKRLLIFIFLIFSQVQFATAEVRSDKDVIYSTIPFVDSANQNSELANQNSDPSIQDIWGTCYFYRDCQGQPIGSGKTGDECQAQNGHSLDVPNHGCMNL